MGANSYRCKHFKFVCVLPITIMTPKRTGGPTQVTNGRLVNNGCLAHPLQMLRYILERYIAKNTKYRLFPFFVPVEHSAFVSFAALAEQKVSLKKEE